MVDLKDVLESFDTQFNDILLKCLSTFSDFRVFLQRQGFCMH